jgi:hypothetical protein
MQLTSLRPRRRRSPPVSAYVEREATLDTSPDLSSIARRIAALIDGPVTEALVVMLTELYGDALSRILTAIAEAPAGEPILDRLCDDRLVGGLLVVHDLHPRPVAARIERALANVEHSAPNVAPPALDRIEDDVAYVRLAAPTGQATRAAIARAIAAAAPEITRVCAEVEAADDHTLHFGIEVLRSP